MIKQPGKGPKLRSKGAECRGLVPFGFELATEMQAKDPSELNLTMLRMMTQLLAYYDLLSNSDYPAELAGQLCRECCLYYKALSDRAKRVHGDDTKRWTVSPKFHMWQEVSEFQTKDLGSPRDFWCYKDEDFVGWVGSLAFSRGGPTGCKVVAQRLIDRYRSWVGSL